MGNEERARLREAVGWVRNALRDHDLFRASVRLDELEALLVESPPIDTPIAEQLSSAAPASEGNEVA